MQETKLIFGIVLIVLFILISGCTSPIQNQDLQQDFNVGVDNMIDDSLIVNSNESKKIVEEENILEKDLEDNSAFKFVSNEEIGEWQGKKYLKSIDPEKILPACFGGKDCIPSIDNPKFVSAKEADSWLSPNDLILGINFNGIQKAYPIKILDRHEIVNDFFADKPIVVSYCPLCGSGVSYYRLLNGEPVEFGVSGKLFNSDLVMYDRKTETYWGQILGEGIVGEFSGYKLKLISTDLAEWQGWKKEFPETLVLSNNQGILPPASYEQYPYGDYFTSNDISIGFPVENKSDKLHPKAFVYGIEINKKTKAYSREDMSQKKLLNDEFAGKSLLVLFNSETKFVKVFDRELEGHKLEFELSGTQIIEKTTNSKFDFFGKSIEGQLKGKQLTEIIGINTFWFGWFVFNPETNLWPEQQ